MPDYAVPIKLEMRGACFRRAQSRPLRASALRLAPNFRGPHRPVVFKSRRMRSIRPQTKKPFLRCATALRVTAPSRCGFLQPWPLLIKVGPMAVFAQQRPRNAQSLSRADRSSLASEASDPRSGLGLDGEHGSGTQLG